MGYHVYQDVWEANHGEILCCFHETGNAFDPFAVCVKKDAEVVGHVPSLILGSWFYGLNFVDQIHSTILWINFRGSISSHKIHEI